MVACDELVEVGASEAVLLEGEVLVGAQVVEPDGLSPWGLTGWFAVEEDDVGLDALRVEDAGGQSQDGVQVAFMHELAAHGFAGSAFEQDVVGHDHGGAAVLGEQALDVLYEVELLVGGGGPEVGTVVGDGLFVRFADLVDDSDARLLAEGRIGDDDGVVFGRRIAQAIVSTNRRFVLAIIRPDAVEEQVHRAEPRDPVYKLNAAQCVVLQVLLLVSV